MNTATAGHRFENVDALRGLAALLVVWAHTAEVFVTLPGVAAHGTGWSDVAELLGLGRAGVVAFFAISGYVIVPTLVGPRGAGARDFLVKRLFRLYPPFWLSMAFAAWALWSLQGRPLDLAIVAANATMIPLEWNQPQMMGHYWTLEVELIFYALVLVLFWTGRLRSDRAVALLVLALAIAWPLLFKSAAGRLLVDRNLVWSFLSYFLAVMFWGAMVRARTTPDRPSHPFRGWTRTDWPFALVTVLVVARPVLAILFGSATVHREDWNGTVIGLLLFLLFVRIPPAHMRAFAWLGTISYSLYLMHPVVFYAMLALATARPSLATLPLAVYVPVAMAITIVLSTLTYRWVEAPSNRIARRLVRRFARPAVTTGAVT